MRFAPFIGKRAIGMAAGADPFLLGSINDTAGIGALPELGRYDPRPQTPRR